MTKCETPGCPKVPSSKGSKYCDGCALRRREDAPYDLAEQTRKLLKRWRPAQVGHRR